jgi:hypothetical protein
MQREGHRPVWFPGGAVSSREEFQNSVHKTDHICFQRMTREHHGERMFEKVGTAGLTLEHCPQNCGIKGILHVSWIMGNVPVGDSTFNTIDL